MRLRIVELPPVKLAEDHREALECALKRVLGDAWELAPHARIVAEVDNETPEKRLVRVPTVGLTAAVRLSSGQAGVAALCVDATGPQPPATLADVRASADDMIRRALSVRAFARELIRRRRRMDKVFVHPEGGK